jgi:hypothetical protein
MGSNFKLRHYRSCGLLAVARRGNGRRPALPIRTTGRRSRPSAAGFILCPAVTPSSRAFSRTIKARTRRREGRPRAAAAG